VEAGAQGAMMGAQNAAMSLAQNKTFQQGTNKMSAGAQSIGQKVAKEAQSAATQAAAAAAAKEVEKQFSNAFASFGNRKR